MKNFVSLILLAPTLALAGTPLHLPLPENNGELCYVRAYSAEHLAKHKNQKIKGAALTMMNHDGFISVKAEVRLLDGKAMFNYGAFINPKVKTRLKASIDDDGGSFYVSQNQAKPDTIRLKIADYLYLQEDNYTTNDQIPEGTDFESMLIEAGTEDAIWNLEQVRVNGSIMKSCSQVLDDRI